jgi:hypothetical protein
MATSYLDEANAGVGSVFQATYAELDVGEIQTMRQLTLERLMTCRDGGQCRLS